MRILKHWREILNTDCVVVGIGDQVLYPIFKVGSSSLMASADRRFTNEQISELANIDVLIRDPAERFDSGLQEYCRQNGTDIIQTREAVERGDLMDRHFVPQIMWLFHLYKYHKGTVRLRPFTDITKITDRHVHPSGSRDPQQSLGEVRELTEPDRGLVGLLGNTLPLETIIKEHRNVLS